MQVQLESPDQPDVLALIAALDVYQRSLYPPESCHLLALAALLQPQVRFVVARDAAGVARGCAALVLAPGWAELKRMYVAPQARGQGVARRLFDRLLAEAHAADCAQLVLETGPLQPEALAFYTSVGFTRRGPFGDYADDPLSVFMALPLAGAAS